MKVFRYFEEYQEKANSILMLRAFRIPIWLRVRTYLIWKRRGKQIRQFMKKVIDVRYDLFLQKKGDTGYDDILEALMKAEDPETKTQFSRSELLDQVVVLFLAGHETSASVLSWAFYILAHQPKHADALAAEALEVFGDDAFPSFKHVHKLKKARDVFRETLRLYPPVSLISREATGRCPLADRKLEPGDTVNISPWLIHRREEIWSDPHAFKPERFSEGENRNEQGAYLPFSLGPRICVGAGFAMQEALLILSTVAKRYVLSPDPSHLPDPVGRLTLRSLNGIQVFISPRTEMPEPSKDSPAEDADPVESGCPFLHD
jgi:cytochrome P450